MFIKILSSSGVVLIVVPENINTSPKDGNLVSTSYSWNFQFSLILF